MGGGGYRKRERVIIFKQEYSDIKGIFQYHKPNQTLFHHSMTAMCRKKTVDQF